MARRPKPPPASVNPLLKQQGMVRTHMYCHGCSNDFLAMVNYDLDGQHEVECPHCGHLHYRTIKAGVVTEDRYSSDSRSRAQSDHPDRNLWKAETVPIATASATSLFLRDLWYRRED